MQSPLSVLVTGGAGYIGSHTCLALYRAGFEVVVLDNLHNSSSEALRRVAALAGRESAPFYEGDIRDKSLLARIFQEHRISSVMHFAGLKAVGESVQQPLAYYENNVYGTLCLVEAMQAAGVKNLIFSSSATVYGDPASTPIREDFPRSATNPYGRSKLMVEDILMDFQHAQPDWQIALLRYFNPVGADASGHIGEDPRGIPNNLMPYIARVAVGTYPMLSVFGNDYDTFDRAGVRDYIHVVDLADGHVAALNYFLNQAQPALIALNLGTGQGYSVLDMVKAFEQASGQHIPYQIVARRAGDIASCFADTEKAQGLLQWQAKKSLFDMCRDTWRWQQQNPQGYH